MTDKKTIWDSAGRAGLVLGLVSTAYFAIGLLLGKASSGNALAGAMIGLGSFVLWAAKFAGCILLMRFFMKRFAAANSGADNNDVLRFGIVTALLSALIYSACYLAYTGFINPDMFTETINATMEQMSSMMDSNSKEAVEALLPRMPVISFFSNLVYCFLFGTVLSVILSRNIPSANPFDNDKPDDQ